MNSESSTNSRNQAPAPTVWPVMEYSDVPAAVEFLVSAFGFEERIVVPGESEKEVVHCELGWPEGGGVMLTSLNAAGGLTRSSVGMGAAYVVASDPDRLYERAIAAGATVLRPIQDEDYGNRSFIVRDIEGNIWTFGHYRGQSRPATS